MLIVAKTLMLLSFNVDRISFFVDHSAAEDSRKNMRGCIRMWQGASFLSCFPYGVDTGSEKNAQPCEEAFSHQDAAATYQSLMCCVWLDLYLRHGNNLFKR